MTHGLKDRLLGSPFPTSRASHERLDKVRALAVFASDTISSNAYATEAIMVVLLALGSGNLGMTFTIAIAIGLLLTLVVISYNQTIQHYPAGGGAYSVAKDNLGTNPSLLAAAALLTDYVLTVSVSVAAGVRALTSAAGTSAPLLEEYRVLLGVLFILVITWINLRGVRESGTIFALPTYAFVVSVLLVLAVGLAGYFGLFGIQFPQTVEHPVAAAEGLTSFATIWLVLRAFAAGCTALTGIEAISNGVAAFQPPEPRNAITTMRVMAIIAMMLFLGISFLATHLHLVPNLEGGESILSQLTRTITGGGPLYYTVQLFTMLILVLAANTAYQDFPRLSALVARDGFMPRWMLNIGHRLVYSAGILTLATISSLLLVAFGGDEIKMLPLYAIGVFISFTLSQSGMVRLWGKIAHLKPGETLQTSLTTLHYEKGWQVKRLANLIGAITTFVVLIVLAATKFLDGAWVVLVAIPMIMFVFKRIRGHYDTVKVSLRTRDIQPGQMREVADVVIVPIADVHRGSLRAIKYANRLSRDVRCIYVVTDPAAEARVRTRWDRWRDFTRPAELITIESPFREVIDPLVEYIERVNHEEFPGQLVTVVVPEFVPEGLAANLLHNQTAALLRIRLRVHDDIVVIDVPYRVARTKPTAEAEPQP